MLVDWVLSLSYFRTVCQVELFIVFFGFFFQECFKHYVVVACEGFMFKSKFSSAFICMMVGVLGMVAVENKLSVGYGAEVGVMSDGLC